MLGEVKLDGSELPVLSFQDPGRPDHQWIDTSGDDPPVGEVFYYEGAAYNAGCSAEGPR